MKKSTMNQICCGAFATLCALLSVVTTEAQTSNVLSRSVIVRDAKNGRVSKSVSKDCVELNYNDTLYYQSKGRYYVGEEEGYRQVAPPIGAQVDKLPKGGVSIKVFNREYYCCRGIVYKESSRGGYEVTLPEVGMNLPELPEADVREVLIDGELYFEADGMVYKSALDGEQYVVVCTLASLNV